LKRKIAPLLMRHARTRGSSRSPAPAHRRQGECGPEREKNASFSVNLTRLPLNWAALEFRELRNRRTRTRVASIGCPEGQQKAVPARSESGRLVIVMLYIR
jgi:hypothetical protein